MFDKGMFEDILRMFIKLQRICLPTMFDRTHQSIYHICKVHIYLHKMSMKTTMAYTSSLNYNNALHV
jgi:hypothetical protein